MCPQRRPGPTLTGYWAAFSLSSALVSTSLSSLKKNTGGNCIFALGDGRGVRFSVRSYTALIEQPSVKSSCEEIISPLRSVPFCCNCVHLIELKETTSFLRISIEVSKIKLSYNYTCFHITLLLASSRVCLKH